MLPRVGAPGPAAVTAGGQRGGDPRDHGQSRRPSEADGWRIFSYLLAGMALYGAAGWLIGRWTGLAFLFPVGMIAGLASAIALIILRVTRY
jgi:ATP synthase protein I